MQLSIESNDQQQPVVVLQMSQRHRWANRYLLIPMSALLLLCGAWLAYWTFTKEPMMGALTLFVVVFTTALCWWRIRQTTYERVELDGRSISRTNYYTGEVTTQPVDNWKKFSLVGINGWRTAKITFTSGPALMVGYPLVLSEPLGFGGERRFIQLLQEAQDRGFPPVEELLEAQGQESA